MSTSTKNAVIDGDDTNGDTMPYQPYGENGTVYVKYQTITLYPTNATLTKAQQKVTAEHEFGHVLGFDHDNRKFKFNGKKYRNYHMIMNKYNNYAHYYGLGGIEQKTLADHYGITPSVDLSALTY